MPVPRDTVRQAGGEGTLVGGSTAITCDLNNAAERDLKVLPPIVLLVILVIIGILLRAIVAPLLLVGTVIVSFLAHHGASVLIFGYVFDFPGEDPSLPLFGFIFLVALGVDYNITEIGFPVAFGVLLDTFIVRSILLSATVIELDRRIWWPSRLSHAGPPPRPARSWPCRRGRSRARGLRRRMRCLLGVQEQA